MKMFKALLENTNIQRLRNKSSEDVKNAFFANYLAALTLLRLQDLPGLKLINDKTHANLNRFSSNMSDLNFWGRALFKSNEKEIKSNLLHGHAELLADESGRITNERIIKTMHVPFQAPEQVNWSDTTTALALLKHRFSVKSSYFTKVSYSLFKWDSLSVGAKNKCVSDSFMYLLQSDPKSNLTPRLRGMCNGVMINTADDMISRFVGFKKLHEEDEGSSVGNIASGDNDIGSDNPALANAFKLVKRSTNQVTTAKKDGIIIKDGKIVRKRVKKFAPKKFKAPEHYIITKAEEIKSNEQ